VPIAKQAQLSVNPTILISLWLCLISSGILTDSLPDARMYLTTLDRSHLLAPMTITSGFPPDSTAIIRLHPEQQFQEMEGFGFTLTGGSALHLSQMRKEPRRRLLQKMFGTGKGELGVSCLRLSIGASDLDEFPWSYCDLPPEMADDSTLSRFSLANDTLFLIPVLREILAISPTIHLMGSPWSPPVWMKDTRDTRGGSLLPRWYGVYAHYLEKYLLAMEALGIRLSSLTVQNEPLHPGNNPSMLMPPADQLVFVRDHLGPLFRKSGRQTRIIIYDHNANRPDYPLTILADPEAAGYIDGTAFHLYEGAVETLSQVHEAFPDKHLYFTEQWIGGPGDFAGDFSWHIRHIAIGAPSNWARIVLQWNLSSNATYTPHTDRGGCTRCLGAVSIMGDEVEPQTAWYIIGHLAPFVRPGFRRIGHEKSPGVGVTAFIGPNRQLVVLMQNEAGEQRRFWIGSGNRYFPVDLESGSVGTLLIPSPKF